MKIQALVAVMAALLSGIMAAKKCPVCDPDACPKLNGANCMAGRTKDECGCCDVCAKMEGEACDTGAEHDPCGDGLECKDAASTGPICQCQFQEIVCGSDGKSYTNLCQLLAAAVRERRTNTLNVKRGGPCEPGARIITKPEYIRNHTHSNVVMQCEAMGMPTPSMTWMFTRADNKTFNVPGDDYKLMTSSRGGPGKYMVTSWLQIEDLQKMHEGDYACVAINQHHTDRAKARIKVVERQ